MCKKNTKQSFQKIFKFNKNFKKLQKDIKGMSISSDSSFSSNIFGTFGPTRAAQTAPPLRCDKNTTN